MSHLDIIIPLWNEARNIPYLISMFENSFLVKEKILGLILVNNGSTDGSQEILKSLTADKNWIKVISLPENKNYGGGIHEGLKASSADFLGFIPGDLQVQVEDVERIWLSILHLKQKQRVFFKGYRKTRMDGFQTRLVSWVYTLITNLILGILVKDANGLPKIFSRDLLQCLNSKVMKTFVIDAQLIATAIHQGWNVHEIPVTFHARREGVSSWSGKKIRVYKESLMLLLQLKREKLTMPAQKVRH